jgi:CrcB protein
MGPIENYLLVVLGSAAGGVSRYALGGLVADRWGAAFPWGTLIVNVTGCFAIGLIMAFAERTGLDPRWRLLLTIGFCGGYTTFSSFAYETMQLLEARDWLLVAAYVLASNVIGLAALWCGQTLARWLW